MCDEIIRGTDRSADIKKCENYFTNLIKPKNFTGDKSLELQVERDFEALCIAMEEHTTRDPKMLNVKEFYALLTFIKDKLDKKR